MEQISEKQLPIIEPVVSGVYRIKVPLPGSPLRNINAYLLKGADRNLLIDTGYRSQTCVNALRQAMKELQCSFENTDILLTHFHDDHAGAATDLVHPGRKIFYPAEEDRWFGISSRQVGLYKASRKQRYLEEGLSPQRFDEMMDYRVQGAKGPDFSSPALTKIQPHEMLRAGNFRLEAIPVPGHTPGHMCYWDPEHQLMFTGDHVLFDISSNIIFWDGIDDILQLYLDSLRKLLEYPVLTALPGHREAGDLHERIRRQLAHHEERLRECEEIIRKKPGCTSMEITLDLTWNIRRRRSVDRLPLQLLRYAFGECISHLDHLQAKSRIIRRVDGNRTAYFAL